MYICGNVWLKEIFLLAGLCLDIGLYGSDIGLQSFKKYLRQTLVFMQNSALREKSNLYFSVNFD